MLNGYFRSSPLGSLLPVLLPLALFAMGMSAPAEVRAQECGIIYVSPTGAPGGAAGTRANPASLSYGLQLTSPANRYLRLAVGRYELTAPLNLQDSLVLEGGWLPGSTWVKTNTDSTVLVRRAVNLEANPPRFTAIQGSQLSGFQILDLRIQVEDAPFDSAAGLSGISLYGIHLDTCANYRINRVWITTGDASRGFDGTPGDTGRAGQPGLPGGTGSRRSDPTTFPDVPDGGLGGGKSPGAWSGGLRAGGDGGDGGDRGTSTACIPSNQFGPDCSPSGDICDPNIASAPDGNDGETPAHPGAGGGGLGRPGLCYCPSGGFDAAYAQQLIDFFNSCPTIDSSQYWGQDGGAGQNGTPGVDGVDASPVFNVYYRPQAGTDGTDGGDGSGGGGGGGGGSVGCIPQLAAPVTSILDPGNLNSSGGGGGGGGEGGEGGTAGTHGTGGGGNFGVFLWRNGPNGLVTDCVFQLGDSGRAGRGGAGGAGGAGGQGGAAGEDQANRGAGCEGGAGGRGGDGGNGGDGGDGGDGSTGPRVDVYQSDGGVPAVVFSIFKREEPDLYVTASGCINSPIELVTVDTATSKSWFLGGIPNSANGDTVTTRYDSVGLKSVSLLTDGIPFTYSQFVYQPFDNVLPEIQASATSVCVGAPVIFSNPSTAQLYFWSFPGSNQPTSSVQNPGPVVWNSPGTYTVTLYTDGCCGRSETDSLTINVVATPAVSLPNDTTLCRIDPRPVLDAGGLTGASYNWFFSGAILPDTNSTYTAQNAGQYIAQVSYPGGCSARDTFNLQLIDSLQVDLGPDVILCENDPPPLLNSGVNDFRNRYLWTRNGNPVATDSVYQPITTGAYRVQVTNPNGCTGSDELSISRSIPNPDLGPDIFFCSNLSPPFIDAQIPNGAYTWYRNDTLLSGQTQQRIQVSQTGVYRVEVLDSLGCPASDSLLVQIGVPVNADFTAPQTATVGAPASFTDLSIPPPSSWTWNFGDNSPLDTTQNPSHTYSTPGPKPVFLIARNGICADTVSTVVEVQNNCQQLNLTASFTVDPPGLNLNRNGSAFFTNTSQNATSFTWLFPDGSTSSASNPSFAFPQKGNYTIYLIARNYNCSDTAQVTVTVVQPNDPPVLSLDGEELASQGLSLYPNPAASFLVLDATEASLAPSRLQLLDLTGRLQLDVSLHPQAQKHRISLPELPNGLYVVRVLDATAEKQARFKLQIH